jgi:NAD(P) transhydrogenase subunit alpha
MISVYLIGLYVFVLSCFVGYEVISKVPPLLHTPLMSGTNAVSGISLVGAVIAAGHGEDRLTTVLGFVAVVCGTVNVIGGYLVTHRMLRMFKRK